TISDVEDIISNLRTQAWVENQDIFQFGCRGVALLSREDLIQDIQLVQLNTQVSTFNASLIRIDSNNPKFLEHFELIIIQTVSNVGDNAFALENDVTYPANNNDMLFKPTNFSTPNDNSVTLKKKGRTRKQREIAKLLRNTGKEYLNEKGETVKPRTMKPLTECRMKCKDTFPDDIRLALFKEYWKLGHRGKRANFLSLLICILDKKTICVRVESDKVRKFSCKYELVVNGERKSICKKCYISTFGETNAFVNPIIQNRQFSVSSIIGNDKRGRSEPKHKRSQGSLNDVVEHIRSFPAYENLQWPRYCGDNIATLRYKSSLSNEDGFKTVKCRRRGKQAAALRLSKLHNGPVPNNNYKKKNLMELLTLIDMEFRPFYEGLLVADVPDIP
ncbi:hypothetical protein ILUMI_20194, partial [Ignelater luminosus]